MKRRKRSKAAKAGYAVAYMLLLSCIMAMFIIAFAMAVGIVILPVEKVIALMIFMMYLTARVGRDNYK